MISGTDSSQDLWLATLEIWWSIMTLSSSTKVRQDWWPVQRVRQRDNESTFSPFVCSGPPWTGSRPATVSRAIICFTQTWISFRSTLTNTPRNDVYANTWALCGPVKLTPEISCHTPKWKQMSLVYSHHTPRLAKISKDGCRSLDLSQRKRVYLSHHLKMMGEWVRKWLLLSNHEVEREKTASMKAQAPRVLYGHNT